MARRDLSKPGKVGADQSGQKVQLKRNVRTLGKDQKPKAEPQPEPEAQPQAEPTPEAKAPQPEPEVKPEPAKATRSQGGRKAKPKAEPQPQAEADPQPEVQPEAEAPQPEELKTLDDLEGLKQNPFIGLAESEIKQLFRKLSKIAHPDLHPKAQKERATRIFQQLEEWQRQASYLKIWLSFAPTPGAAGRDSRAKTVGFCFTDPMQQIRSFTILEMPSDLWEPLQNKAQWSHEDGYTLLTQMDELLPYLLLAHKEATAGQKPKAEKVTVKKKARAKAA